MPPPLKLEGKKLGKLTVISRAKAPTDPDGKQASYRTWWLCQCECGRQEVFPQKRLPYVASNIARSDAAYACSACRFTRICKQCGATFESAQYKATCSEQCAHLHKCKLDLEHYYRRVQKDPHFNSKRYEAIKKRAQTDPEFAARIAERNRKIHERRWARILADPDKHAQVLQRGRDYYAAHREEILARRMQRLNSHPALREQFNAKARERWAKREDRREIYEARRARYLESLASMSPAQREAAIERKREAHRRYKQLQRSTPEGAAAERAAYARWLAKRQLNQMIRIAQELNDRLNK